MDYILPKCQWNSSVQSEELDSLYTNTFSVLKQEISLMQLAAGGLPKWRRKYRKCEKRLTTIKENTRQVTTPSVNYSRPTATEWNCNCYR